MNPKEAVSYLHQHSDPDVRAAAVVLTAREERLKQVLELVKDALSQLRVDIKYLAFDLEATRRERDEARGAL